LASTGQTTDLAADAADASATLRRPTHLVFALGGERYACALKGVREVVPFGRVTRLPGAPSYVCGLMNLRGTIVTVVDLGARLGGAPVDRSDGVVLLVSRDPDGTSDAPGARVAGLAVDLVHDVRALDEERAVRGRGDGSLGAESWLGVARLDGEPVGLLDVCAIVRNVLI
jgi:purine-binding chemotaxis protein CheW